VTNLEKVIEKIIKDAKKEAKAIVQEAEKERAKILAEERKKAEREVSLMIERAKREAKIIKEQAVSSAKIHARDEVLRAKGEIIDRVIQEVLKQLQSLDDDTYIQFIKERLEEEKFTKEAKLIVPENKRKLVRSLQLPIQLDEDESVQSGFMIKEGRIVRNQTFESVIAHYRDELQIKIAQQLFDE